MKRQKIHEWFYQERPQWILWVPFFLGLGVVIYFTIHFEPSIQSAASAVLLTVGGLLWARKLPRIPEIKLLMILLCLVMTGFLGACVRTHLLDTTVLSKPLRPSLLMGTVVDLEDLGKARRLIIKTQSIENLDADKTPSYVRIRGFWKTLPGIGDKIQVLAKLSPPPPPTSPGDYDFQRFLYYKKIGATGFSLGQITLIEPAKTLSPVQWINRLRLKIQDYFQGRYASDTGEIMSALTVGRHTGISKETLNDFRNTGLTHILSISGLHFVMVVGFAFTVLRRLMCLIPRFGQSGNVKKAAAVISILIAFLYLLLAGAPIPTQRAFLMTSCVLIAVLLDRRGISLRLVMIAAGVIILLRPEAVMSPSFQLSFAAVIALVAFYEAFYDKLWVQETPKFWTNSLKYICAAAVTSLVAEIATMAFGVYHFNQVTLYNMLANAVVTPIVMFVVMPGLMLGGILAPFGLQDLALTPAAWGIQAMQAVAAQIAQWPGAMILVPSFTPVGVILMVLGGLWLCLWKQRPRLAGIPVFLIGASSFLWHPNPDILISDTGKLFGVYEDNTLYLNTRRRERFESDAWQMRLGADIRKKIDDYPGAICTPQGCRFQVKGRHISYVFDKDAFTELCAGSDIVISWRSLRGECSAPTLLDYQFIKRQGAISIFINTDITLKTTAQSRGSRPWIP